MELDLFFYCIEKFLYQHGIRNVSGETNAKFAKFLERRGWQALPKKGEAIVSKRLSPKNNPRSLVFRRIKIRKKRAAAPMRRKLYRKGK